jgi:hypothetical protein
MINKRTGEFDRASFTTSRRQTTSAFAALFAALHYRRA